MKCHTANYLQVLAGAQHAHGEDEVFVLKVAERKLPVSDS